MNTIFSLRKIINGDVNVICYDWNDVVPPCLRSISQSDYNTLSPIHIPTKEYDIIMDEKNRREGTELEISVSIGTQDTTYDYNDGFWGSI